MDTQANRELVLTKNYTLEGVNDDYVLFKDQCGAFFALATNEDPQTFDLRLQWRHATETYGEKQQAAQIVYQVTYSTNCVKMYFDPEQGDVVATFESFLGEADAAGSMLDRGIFELRKAAMEFKNEMQNASLFEEMDLDSPFG